MSGLTIAAIYENGVLKPEKALPLKDQQHVRITVHPTSSWVERTYGLLAWNGDSRTLESLAIDPANDPQEIA